MTRTDDAWSALQQVVDPEIPVVSVVDLGIVRTVAVGNDGSSAVVEITPTYSGCPALHVIEESIGERLRELFDEVEVRTVLSPAWTTDWISERGRANLREHGIAPPAPVIAPTRAMSSTFAVLGAAPPAPACPRCDATDVDRISQFGSTACKALWRCRACGEPFDQFKAL